MDIIDSFVVTLGLDPRQYQREIRNYRDDRKRLAEEDARYNRDQQDANKRLVDGVRTLRNETAGFLFMLASANGVKDFVSNIVSGDAATGRLARNLGIATEELSAWEGAIKRVGGTAQDIDGALRSMTSAFQSLQLTGTTGHDADFQGLGVTAADLRDPSQALLKISEASQRMNRPEFNARLSRIGFDQNTINLLARGRGEVTKMLDEQRKLGVVTDQNAEAAERFQEKLAMIETGLKGKFRPAIEGVVGVLGDWLSKGENLNIVMDVTVGLLGAAAIAAGVAYAPFFALAGIIATLAANFDTSNSAMNAWSNTISGVSRILNGDFKGGFGQLWDEFKREAQDTVDDVNEWAGLPDKNGRKQRIASRDTRPSTGWFGSSVRSLTGQTPTPASGGGGKSNGQDIVAFFKSRGYTDAQARGITAGIIAESGGDHTARNPTSGAYGLGQHLSKDRRENFRKRYGVDITRSTRQQQLDFLDWELKGGDAGGKAVRAATTASGALDAYVKKFMRPAPGAETWGDIQRGNAWLGNPGATVRGGGAGGGQTVSQTTTVGEVNVYTAATDADGIVKDMRGALAKRGLVAQANTGLTG